MQYFIILFFFLAAALICLLYVFLRIPPTKTGKRFRSTVRKKETPGAVLSRVVLSPLLRPLAAIIPMKPAREAELAQQLRRVDIAIPPKEYYARAMIMAGASLLIAPLLMVAGLPQMAPVAGIFALIVFFHFTSMHKDALKAKQERIELGLPGFIRSIIHRLSDTSEKKDKKETGVKIDLISVFEDYLVVANDVFYYDVAYLITEMKSKDSKTALRNFSDRIGLPEVTFLVQALLGLDKGEDQKDALKHLARDVDLKARENIRKQLAKRPGKMRLATIPLVIVAIGTLLFVIVTHLFQSVGGLF